LTTFVLWGEEMFPGNYLAKVDFEPHQLNWKLLFATKKETKGTEWGFSIYWKSIAL